MTERNKTRKTGQDAIDEINLRLGGLLDALGDTISEVARAAGDGRGGESIKEHVFETPDGPLKARAGIRVRFAGVEADADTGGPTPRRSARTATTPSDTNRSTETTGADAKAPPAPRQPVAELEETATDWILTVEMPGCRREDLTLGLTDGILTLETPPPRSFAYSRAAPEGATIDTLDFHFANGILEIRFDKS